MYLALHKTENSCLFEFSI